MDKRLLKRLSAPLLAAALWTIPLHSHADTQPLTSQDTKLLTSQIVDQYAEHIFYNSGAVGMALVVIDNNQVVNRSFGETQPGNNIRPRPDSLIRIASITKLMTSEIMVKLADDGIVKLTDPLKNMHRKGSTFPLTVLSNLLGCCIWPAIPAASPVSNPAARKKTGVYLADQR